MTTHQTHSHESSDRTVSLNRVARYCLIALIVGSLFLSVASGAVAAQQDDGSSDGPAESSGIFCGESAGIQILGGFIQTAIQLFAALAVGIAFISIIGTGMVESIPFLGGKLAKTMKQQRIQAYGGMARVVVIPIIVLFLLNSQGIALECLNLLPFGIGQ